MQKEFDKELLFTKDFPERNRKALAKEVESYKKNPYTREQVEAQIKRMCKRTFLSTFIGRYFFCWYAAYTIVKAINSSCKKSTSHNLFLRPLNQRS